MDLKELKTFVMVVLKTGGRVAQYGKALQDALTAAGETHPHFMKALVDSLSENPPKLKLTEDELVELIQKIPSLSRIREITNKVPEARQKEISVRASLSKYPMLSSILKTYR
jgi:hypothetical protein